MRSTKAMRTGTATQPNGIGIGDYGYVVVATGEWWDHTSADTASVLVEWNADAVLDGTDALTYSIAAQSVAGAFEIDADSGEIRVADGTLLDADTLATHTVTVRVTDNATPTANTYDEDFTISLNNLVEDNNAPTDLSSGIELNTDGGNDAFLYAANDLIGSLNAVTVETTFAIEHASGQNHTLIDFHSAAGIDDELLLRVLSDGSIQIGVGDTNLTSTGTYGSVLDGEVHHLALSWDSSNGDWAIYIDGVYAESGTGLHSGSPLSAGTNLSIGQSFDDAGDSDTIYSFSGTLYDVRIWNEVRSEAEIALNYQHKFDSGSLPSG